LSNDCAVDSIVGEPFASKEEAHFFCDSVKPKMGIYADFRHLKAEQREGIDYRIHLRRGASGVAVMAIHGGDIEPGTSEVATALAASDHSLYLFEGIKDRGNRRLHLASTRFNEPMGLRLARESELVVTVHGCSEKDVLVLVGGLCLPVVSQMRRSLVQAGFPVNHRDGLRGVHPMNVCNLGKRGQGVQLELSSGLRKAMFPDLTRSGRERTTKVFHRFLAALAAALQESHTWDLMESAEVKRHAETHLLPSTGNRSPDGA